MSEIVTKQEYYHFWYLDICYSYVCSAETIRAEVLMES